MELMQWGERPVVDLANWGPKAKVCMGDPHPNFKREWKKNLLTEWWVGR